MKEITVFIQYETTHGHVLNREVSITAKDEKAAEDIGRDLATRLYDFMEVIEVRTR
jgi:hypothetical protein